MQIGAAAVISLPCPHCGSRDAAEFAYIGERVSRPDPNAASPQEWRGYLYLRRNPAGWTDELWLHRAGCGRYLAVSRNTLTGECSSIMFGRHTGAPPGPQTSWRDANPAERDRTTSDGGDG